MSAAHSTRKMKLWHSEHAKHTIMTDESRKKAQETFRNLGPNHPRRRIDVRTRHSEIMRAKGKKHHSKRPSVRKKISESHKALGDKHWSKRKEVRDRMRESHLAWGANHPAYSKASRKKALKTRIKRGNLYPSDETRAKMSASRLAMGDRIPTKLPSVRAKISLAHGNSSWKKTGPEKTLHDALDKRTFKYGGLDRPSDHRGQPISADIYAPTAKLIIEMDGCYWHYCSDHRKKFDPVAKAKSQERDRILTKRAEDLGYTVIRVWEHDVLNRLDEIVTMIKETQRRLSRKPKKLPKNAA